MSFDIDVRRQLGRREIAARIVTDARVVAVVGSSGAGKTSLLNMVAGLLRPDAGHVRLDGDTLFDAGGADVPPEQRRIGYVFQEHRLFPHRRVGWNLDYGARLRIAEERWITRDETVDLLGIGHLLDRWPRNLSGGEAQRVAIGRALLSAPRALLLDEPLAALDPARRDGILTVLEQIRDTLALPMIYVSHDRADVARLAGHVVEMGGGE
ncbi:molybdate transport system ATP-binding protein [Sphingomonas jejuensis]|uniref:Molybdate transport system ATP-binding protein n=1 Tax=Sphingomonas jejuensis TaxID=904715 RepID=A0ABX0XNA1_9SPHN|nr:ATP-binding cassette domain-containing protein [Sphingomonas jejuensis]NJC34201.1 molybdate transport system ATP-binding protein [Sphingomonas jejuensis]